MDYSKIKDIFLALFAFLTKLLANVGFDKLSAYEDDILGLADAVEDAAAKD